MMRIDPTESDLARRFGDEPLVGFHLEGDGAPLVLVRTWTDEVEKHAAVARGLGPGQPVVSVAAPMTDDDYPRTVSEWADRCLTTVRTHVGDPARLGGWSFGGTIALELAGRLRAEGRTVDPVTLFDSSVPRTHERTRAGAVHETLRRLVRILDVHPAGIERRRRLLQATRHAPSAWMRWGRRRMRWLSARIARSAPKNEAFDRTAMTPRKRAIWTAYLKYKPGQIDLAVQMLATEDSRRSAGGDAMLGWGRSLVGTVEVFPVPGDHYSMFEPDNVAPMIDALRTWLHLDGPPDAGSENP